MSPDKEIEFFWSYIVRSVDRMVACLDGLDKAEDLNWHPLDNANSLYVLPNHIMSNMEETILGLLCGQETGKRQRENDFKVMGSSAEPVRQKWQELQKRIAANLAQLPDDALEREYEHPRRGKITGRDILIIVARHAAEHMGHAQLTRDLLFAAQGWPIPYREY